MVLCSCPIRKVTPVLSTTRLLLNSLFCLFSSVLLMGANVLQIVKRTLEGLSIIVNALPIPDPFKSAVVGIPDAVLEIITILEVSGFWCSISRADSACA